MLGTGTPWFDSLKRKQKGKFYFWTCVSQATGAFSKVKCMTKGAEHFPYCVSSPKGISFEKILNNLSYRVTLKSVDSRTQVLKSAAKIASSNFCICLAEVQKKPTKNVQAEDKGTEPITQQGKQSQSVEHSPGEATHHVQQGEAAEVTTWETTL